MKQVNGTRVASGGALASYGASVWEKRAVSAPGGLWRRGLHPSAGEQGVRRPRRGALSPRLPQSNPSVGFFLMLSHLGVRWLAVRVALKR